MSCAVVFYSRDGQTAFYFTDMLRETFVLEEFPPEFSHVSKNFYDVNKPEEVFQWLQGPFFEGMYRETEYNNVSIPADRLRMIIGVNKIIGLVRLRQLRVRPNTCRIPQQFDDYISDCFASYSSRAAERAPFGPNNIWSYNSDSQAFFGGYNGLLMLYPDHGYFVDLPKDRASAATTLEYLKNNAWIDLQTRLVAVEFTVFNSNLNLFCVMRLAFELPSGGGVLPNASFRTVNLLRFSPGSINVFSVVMESVLGVLVVVYIIEELIELVQACRGKGPNGHRGWRRYFVDDPWNYLDVLNYALFIVVFMFRLMTVFKLNDIFRSEAFRRDSSYVNFQGIALMQTQELNVNAFNMLLCWIKTLKYFSRIERVNHLSKTLSRAATDAALFIIIFFIFFFAYAQAGWMMFSVDVKGFRTIMRSCESLMLSVFGAFDYDQLVVSNRYLAPLFFFSYMLMTSFILLNMFIAIIDNAYDSVRSNAARREAEDRVTAMLNGRVERITLWAQLKRGAIVMHDALLVNRYRRRQAQLARIQSAKVDLNDDGLISQAEANVAMRPVNTEAEAEETFKQLDADGDLAIEKEELQTWIDDLMDEKAYIEDALGMFVDLERSLAEEGKKLSPEQVAQREEISTRLEDYKTRVRHLGAMAPDELKQLTVRSSKGDMDPALLSQLAAAGSNHADIVRALAALQTVVQTGFQQLNSKMHTMSNRVKRLEDNTRLQKLTSTRTAAGVRTAATISAEGGRRPAGAAIFMQLPESGRSGDGGEDEPRWTKPMRGARGTATVHPE